MEPKASTTRAQRAWPVPGHFLGLTAALSLLITALWLFPGFWYTTRPLNGSFTWFAERDALDGWSYSAVPISKTAEAFLVADRTFNGQFARPDGTEVRAYSAKRYLK